MARRLLLVRHARPTGVEPGVLLGSTDVALDAASRAEACAAAGCLREDMGDESNYRPRSAHSSVPVSDNGTYPLFDACVSSPLTRCRQTAEILAAPLPVELDDELREIDFGRWETSTLADVSASEPESVERWSRFDPAFAFPGGEGLMSFVQRVHRCAVRLASHPADTLLVVTHGGMIRMLLCHYLGLEPKQYVLFAPGYLSVATLDLFGDRGVLAFDGEGNKRLANDFVNSSHCPLTPNPSPTRGEGSGVWPCPFSQEVNSHG